MVIQKLCTHTFLFDPATTSFQWTKFWCGVYVVEYFGARSVECSFVRSSEGSLRGREGVRGGEMRPSELSLFTPSCTLSARSLTPTRTLFTTLPLYIIRRRVVCRAWRQLCLPHSYRVLQTKRLCYKYRALKHALFPRPMPFHATP